ncbi:MAG: gliding motility-associated C-terminal domain-containing protein [Bacteroidaceae bacterium]|nr:gliding motility-associated C-terminal domain-containing protein [Bacteroidaceae bacterium]
MKRLLKSVLMLAAVSAVFAETDAQTTPSVNVRVMLVSAVSDTVTLVPGGTASEQLQAPIHAIFESELISEDNSAYTLFPQWNVTRTYQENGQSNTVQYLKRQEACTEFRFEDDGQYEVRFEWSYKTANDIETVPGNDIDPISFTIDASGLKMYNAFSPNGDGINDMYCIFMKSIVRAEITIFNRWGQTIKSLSGTMDELIDLADGQADGDGYMLELWDGMHNGQVVKDGVYFIHVKAVGAGGRKYDEKESINVLKGLGETW